MKTICRFAILKSNSSDTRFCGGWELCEYRHTFNHSTQISACQERLEISLIHPSPILPPVSRFLIDKIPLAVFRYPTKFAVVGLTENHIPQFPATDHGVSHVNICFSATLNIRRISIHRFLLLRRAKYAFCAISNCFLRATIRIIK